MRKINYNYVFLFYDVGEERVQKVFKICKKYLSHHQNSVFRGSISPSLFMELKGELKKVIDPSADSVSFIKLISDKNFAEESMGVKHENGECLIL